MRDVHRTAWARGMIVLTFMGLALAAGCNGGGYQGADRASVTGTVTFDGEAVENGVINFVPLDRDSRRASGSIAQGRYAIAEDMGPNLGKYRVEIYWSKPTGEEPAAEEGGDPDATAPTEQVIPEKYNTDSTLEVEITAGANKHDFALTSE